MTLITFQSNTQTERGWKLTVECEMSTRYFEQEAVSSPRCLGLNKFESIVGMLHDRNHNHSGSVDVHFIFESNEFWIEKHIRWGFTVQNGRFGFTFNSWYNFRNPLASEFINNICRKTCCLRIYSAKQPFCFHSFSFWKFRNPLASELFDN